MGSKCFRFHASRDKLTELTPFSSIKSAMLALFIQSRAVLLTAANCHTAAVGWFQPGTKQKRRAVFVACDRSPYICWIRPLHDLQSIPVWRIPSAVCVCACAFLCILCMCPVHPLALLSIPLTRSRACRLCYSRPCFRFHVSESFAISRSVYPTGARVFIIWPRMHAVCCRQHQEE